MDKNARKRIVDVEDDWELVKQLLPEGWERQARELGAVRRLRGVGSVESLLRILLLHLADGCSLIETALRAKQAGFGDLSSVGIFKRLRRADRWLAWMAAGMRRHGPAASVHRCLAVDATTVREQGRTGGLYRVHWCLDLASLQCRFMEVTDVHGGETFARFPLQHRDVVLADRGYSNPNGVDYVRGAGAHVLIRANPMSLPFYRGKNGKKMNATARLRGLKLGRVRAWPAWVKGSGEQWHRGRLVAVKRSAAATRREIRRRQKILGSRNRKLGPRGRFLAGYFLVWTSVPAGQMNPRAVLRTYRYRWQLELTFKRLKSIMGLGQLPKYSDASSLAWLNGKLLVAMLVEKLWRNAEHFSPWGYRLEVPAEPMA